MRYMPVRFGCGLSCLDGAVLHSQGKLGMKLVSQIALVTGVPCAKRQKVEYNYLTTGVGSSSQATRDLPQED